jgi:hypothetical protein
LRHKSKRTHSHRSTENLTRGKFPQEAAQQQLNSSREKSRRECFEFRSHPTRLCKSGHSVFASWLKNSTTGRILVFAPFHFKPSFCALHHQKIKKESPLSRGFFFCFFYNTVRSFHYCPHQRYACYPSPSSPPYHRPRRCVFFHQHTRFPDTRPFCAASIHRAHRPHIDRNALTLLSVPLLPTHPLMSSTTLSSLDPFTVFQ